MEPELAFSGYRNTNVKTCQNMTHPEYNYESKIQSPTKSRGCGLMYESMSEKDLEKIASTPHKDLPETVED